MALLWLLPVATLAVFVGFAYLRRGHPEGEGAVALVQRSAHRSVPHCECFGDVLYYYYVWLGFVWQALGYLLWRQRGTATERSSRAS